MSLLEEIKLTIDVLKRQRKFKTQKDVATFLGYNPSYFSRLMGGSEDIPIDFENKFFTAFPKSVYLNSKTDMFTNIVAEDSLPYKQTDKKADALEQLKKVTSKPNGRQKNANEGTILTDDHLVPVKTYIIPIKGFAGLRKHFFMDDYIRSTFEETLTYVNKSERVPVLLKIQADGNSMPPLISPGDHVLCEPINDMTLDYKFKAEKIYCFFHHLRGILFKRAKNMPFDKIELSSDNDDKMEYPNEIFDMGEFKKILIVRTIEKKV